MDERKPMVAGAVFATLSRFNHSCAPNCSWWGGAG